MQLAHRRRARMQVGEQAEADSAPRDGAQLLLDRPQHRAGLARAIEIDANGEEGREPADGAREIGAGDDVLTAVPFQFDDDAVATRPLAQRAGQCGQQDVVDLRVVDVGHVLEDRPGLVLVEHAGDGLGRFDQVGPQVVIARHEGIAAPRDVCPELQLLVEVARRHGPLESEGPVTE